MVFRKGDKVFTVMIQGSEPDFRGDWKSGWVPYDDMPQDHEAVQTAVAMIEAAFAAAGRSYTRLLSVVVDYDTSHIKVAVEPVKAEREVMYELDETYHALETAQETQRVYQDKGSRYDIVHYGRRINRLLAHLGRNSTRSAVADWVMRDQADEHDADLAAITI